MKIDLIVSRHPAAIEFLAKQLGGNCIPVLAQATAADVRGKVVVGNLPLHLACLCEQVIAIEFTEKDICLRCGDRRGQSDHDRKYNLGEMDRGSPGGEGGCGDAHVWASGPPRGQEYTVADMEAAGAKLAVYRVIKAESTTDAELLGELASRGYMVGDLVRQHTDM